MACAGAAVVALWGCAAALGAAATEGAPGRLVVSDAGELLRNGQPCRAVGVNYFDAFIRRLHDPRDTSYREGFAELGRRGIPFVRFAACGFWPSDMALYLHDREAYFRLMDDVVRAAEEHGVGLIPSLFWYSACVPDLVGEPRGEWGNPQSKTVAFMRQYTSALVSRYVDSPAIWAWEFGNEYNLCVDLPNAAEHRPWIVPDRGTPDTRSEADDMRHDMLVSALREFGRVVRVHDATRPITSGNSLPRPSAHHQRIQLSWTRDTPAEFMDNLTAANPAPVDLVSIHLYPHARERRFDRPKTTYDELLTPSMDACRSAGKALFVGEFGAQDDDEHGGRDRARREGLALLSALDLARVPLAALWVFDFPHQDSFINVTASNHRSYLLDAVEHANRRIRLDATGLHRTRLAAGGFSAVLLDNEANSDRSGNGLNPLDHSSYPGESLFRHDMVGLNFEHVFTGAAADKGRAMFTPRRDACTLIRHGDASASLHWPGAGSAWGLDCEMAYAFAAEDAIDLVFRAVPGEETAGKHYLVMMWASYMNHTRERMIHFYGVDGDTEGWQSFGEPAPHGFETGAVRCRGAAPLPFEPGAEALNLTAHPTKAFTLPFFYGLVDGDGDIETGDDTMAYVMMFDCEEPIRFALWNYTQNAAGEPDPHSPAWDWQFVIQQPEPGKTYRYRARILYRPFTTAETLKQAYLDWRSALE
ncbi:MAG: cellulase family glycosylhydrolase [Candidatus Hydrogenedentes bacterium]|nr:cellulase family glycosylhydrolase [Candidatus Hydrogenedentota bacterium]